VGVQYIYKNNTQKELPLYGASRLGVLYKDDNTSVYEITDHLGNVRATIAKNTSDPNIGLDVKSYADYYPFGMKMPGKFGGSSYRYAYQGKFAEKDDETGLLSFEAGMYDPRIGRWFSTDPYGIEYTPYMAMSNNPVVYYDKDGRIVPLVTGTIGAIAGIGINAYSQYSSGELEWSVKSISRLAIAGVAGGIAGATLNPALVAGVTSGGELIDQLVQHNGNVKKVNATKVLLAGATSYVGGKAVSKMVHNSFVKAQVHTAYSKVFNSVDHSFYQAKGMSKALYYTKSTLGVSEQGADDFIMSKFSTSSNIKDYAGDFFRDTNFSSMYMFLNSVQNRGSNNGAEVYTTGAIFTGVVNE